MPLIRMPRQTMGCINERSRLFFGPFWAPVGRNSVFVGLDFEYVFINRCVFPNMN